MNFKEICKPLEGLYTITKLDWHLSIHHSLTEPTCPTITIVPEGTNITRYKAHCNPDQVEQTFTNLIRLVTEEVVEGKLHGRAGHPMTNSDDSLFEQWLIDRQSDKDLEFPYQKFYDIINKRYKENSDENDD